MRFPQQLTALDLLGSSAFLAAPPAFGDEPSRVVSVGTGPEGEALASALATRAASSDADSGAFRGALGAAAIHGLSLAAKKRDKDAEFVTRARAAARTAHADKAILVHVEKARNKGGVVHVWVVDAQGNGGALVDEDVRVAASASAGDETDAAWSVIASAFPAKAPESETPAPASAGPSTPPASPSGPVPLEAQSPKPPDADTAPDASTPHAPPATGTRARTPGRSSEPRCKAGSRHFSYVDRLTPTLRPYDLFVAPRLAIHGEIYPFVNSSIPVLAELGATGTYARAFGIGSQDSSDGTKVGTSWQAFDLGLRERLPIGSSFVLGIDAGYEDTSFAFDDAVRPGAQLPSVHYKVLRGGLDGRLALGPLSVHAGAGYLDVLSTGDFAALFPRASVAGIDAAIGVSDKVTSTLELSLDVVYTRFFYNLSPVPGDTYVAGGALDEMATLSLGLAYLF